MGTFFVQLTSQNLSNLSQTFALLQTTLSTICCQIGLQLKHFESIVKINERIDLCSSLLPNPF